MQSILITHELPYTPVQIVHIPCLASDDCSAFCHWISLACWGITQKQACGALSAVSDSI